MGFVIQRRVNFKDGLGLNISKSGISASIRTKYGTFGSKGFSIRSGIPGFSWRTRYSKKDSGLSVIAFLIIWIFFSTLFFILELCISFVISTLFILLPIIYRVILWLTQVMYDYLRYLVGVKYIKEAPKNEPATKNNTQDKILPYNDKKIIESDTINSIKRERVFIFDYKMFLLIDEVADNLLNTEGKIIADASVLEIINKNKFLEKDSSIQDTLNLLILHDIAKVFRLLIQYRTLKSFTIEIFSFAFIFFKLSKIEGLNTFGDVENILHQHNEKILSKYFDICMNFLNTTDDSAEKNVGILRDDENNKIAEYESFLFMPQVLKISNEPLFEEYTTNLFKFSTLIITINGTVTKKEEKLLKILRNWLFKPFPQKVVERICEHSFLK